LEHNQNRRFNHKIFNNHHIEVLVRSGKIKCGAKALALCVGAKANVPLRVGNKILKKCAVGKKIKNLGSA